MMEIYLFYGQLTAAKSCQLPVSHDHITGQGAELIQVVYFLKFTTDQLMVFHWIAVSRVFTSCQEQAKNAESLLGLAKFIYY